MIIKYFEGDILVTLVVYIYINVAKYRNAKNPSF
jgi:hypothetical protein